MSEKPEDPKKPEQPSPENEPTFFRFLPPNPTKEQVEDLVGNPWFFNWMVYMKGDEFLSRPPTFQVITSPSPTSETTADLEQHSKSSSADSQPDTKRVDTTKLPRSTSDE